MYLYFSVFVYLSQIQKYTIRSHIRSTWFHIFGLQGFTYLVYYASHIWSTRVHRQNLLKSPSHTHIYKATLHFAASLPILVCVNFLWSIIMLHLVLLQFAIHLSAPIGTFQQALGRLYHSLLLKKHDQIQLLVRNMTIDILKHAAGYFPVLPVDWTRWLPCQQQRVPCTFVHLYIVHVPCQRQGPKSTAGPAPVYPPSENKLTHVFYKDWEIRLDRGSWKHTKVACQFVTRFDIPFGLWAFLWNLFLKLFC